MLIVLPTDERLVKELLNRLMLVMGHDSASKRLPERARMFAGKSLWRQILENPLRFSR
jgi:hypothetical protein